MIQGSIPLVRFEFQLAVPETESALDTGVPHKGKNKNNPINVLQLDHRSEDRRTQVHFSSSFPLIGIGDRRVILRIRGQEGIHS
jgi:hypothetical protein